MADTRINALTTSTVSVTDDFLPIDGTTAGTKKLSAYSPSFGGAVTVGQTLTVNGGTSTFAGNVLIGTTTDGGQKLQVISGDSYIARFTDGSTASVNIQKSAIVFANSGISAYAAGNYDASSHTFKIQTVTALTLDSSQNATFSGPVTISKAQAAAYTSLTIQNGNASGYSQLNMISGSNTASINYAPGVFFKISIPSADSFQVSTNNITALTLTSAQQVQVNATTASTSTSTGALVVSGGVGVAGAIYGGGVINTSVGTGGVGTQLVLNNNATNATIGRGSALVYTGTGDANLASIESQTATASNNTGKLIIKTSNSGTLAIAATYDENGNLIQKVNGTAPSLAVNSTMSFELTSNTSLKIFVRGSDGTTRSTTLTLA